MTEFERNQLKKISTFLDSINYRLVEDLQKVFHGDYGLNKRHTLDDIDLVDFEINEDGYRINLYLMNAENQQIGYKALLPEYPNGFLRDMDLDIDEDFFDFNDDRDMDRMDKFYDELNRTVMDWFRECWQKAGQPQTSHKFYIALHDSNRSFDLQNQKWINNKNK